LADPSTIQPLVSVVLCSFNGKKFLRPQLDSILSQSYRNLELIVSDDFSTDGTVDILQEYSQKDPRIKFVVNRENLGYNRNFEKAFSLASAEFIAISDQDDIWEENKIASMMKEWLPGSLFMYSLSGNFNDDDFASRKPAPRVRYEVITKPHQLVFSSPVHGHACMFKKELLNHCTPFPDTIYYDWWMSMCAVKLAPVGCVPQTFTWHRMHSGNSSRTILSVEDKEERNRQLRQQFIQAIETYYERTAPSTEDDQFLLDYTNLLKKTNGKRFSFPLFSLILKNRKKVFHYKKKKPLLFLSHWKHALRMARTGVL
jgi:glycosyltransferase involved in cell wall biosynthesis